MKERKMKLRIEKQGAAPKWACFKLLVTIIMLCFCLIFVGNPSVSAAKNGFVTKSGKTYYYQNGKKAKGLMTINGYTYYFSSKGVMAKKCFKTVKGKKYYFAKNGKAYLGYIKIGKYYYYFDASGVMQKGWQTIGENTYYFQSNGRSLRDCVRYLDGIFASFDENGVYQLSASYVMSGLRRMQVQYKTDPVVKDEILLAAILQAEAGGEIQYPVKGTYNNRTYTLYKGQLAVGYTIFNRMDSVSFPNSLREVIYQQYQFEPARTGVLTNLLNNPSQIRSTCKNAAKVILADYKKKTNSVEEYSRSDFKWKNFWALTYAKSHSDFFGIYKEKEYEIIGNQVFFNYTKAIHSF